MSLIATSLSGFGRARNGGNDQYTTSLLHFDGTDASTTFTDDNFGGGALTWTASGNAQIDTANAKFGVSSGLFDGTGDYISSPDATNFTFGAGDWTIDLWFNCTATSGSTRRLNGQSNSTVTVTTRTTSIRRSASNLMGIEAFVGSTTYVANSTTQFTDTLNTGWHHCAAVRTGNILKLFIDGIQESGDVAITGTINDGTSQYSIGRHGEYTPDTWQGWVDEHRISIGIARWTNNFTPPNLAYYR